MRLFNFTIILMILFSSCKEEEEVTVPILSENYGQGMYIVTDMGISFYNYKDPSSQIESQIFRSVNNSSIINPKSIKIDGNKGYIVANQFYVVDINTFGLDGQVNGFTNAVQCEIIYDNRALVVDKGESSVKVIDLDNFQITQSLETGDSTKPSFIINNSITAFVLNGGGATQSKKDSTVVIIECKDGVIPLAQHAGVLSIGENPNSAVIPYNLEILCKGVYNPSNMINNSESSLYVLNQYNQEIYSSHTLSGIYNAQDLIKNSNSSVYYFTAVGGIYRLDPITYNTNLLLNVNSDLIRTSTESYEYADTDSTTVTYYNEILYMNDLDFPNKIYKYNLMSSSFEDTLVFDGTILDIQFKN